MALLLGKVPSPIGELRIVSDGRALCLLDFGDDDLRFARQVRARFGDQPLTEGDDPLELASRLRAYFAGDLDALRDLPVDPGGSDFQQAVWAALREIPRGRTWSYGQLARHIGQPSASRAVGLANGQNPVAVVVPCHRVIGADGSLTGFGGGIERKRWLLLHEGAMAAELPLGLPA